MAETAKVLGQSRPPATTLTTIYTCPSGGPPYAVASSLVIANTGAADTTFRVSIAINAAADALSQYIYYDIPLKGKNTFIATIGLSLDSNDAVRVWSGNGNLSFTLMGVEVT